MLHFFFSRFSGQFQGAALTVVLEGAELTTEEVCNLQMSPSWSRRGQTSNYGGGLLSCYNIADVLFLISSGCLYLFDPSGEILAPSFSTGKDSSSMKSPKGKAYTFQGKLKCELVLLLFMSLKETFYSMKHFSN